MKDSRTNLFLDKPRCHIFYIQKAFKLFLYYKTI